MTQFQIIIFQYDVSLLYPTARNKEWSEIPKASPHEFGVWVAVGDTSALSPACHPISKDNKASNGSIESGRNPEM